MAIFAILGKDTEKLIFDQLCYNGEKYGKLVVMETIRPAHLPSNTKSTPIKSKIPEYASQFKKEWLVIRGINKECGEVIGRLNNDEDLFNSPQANRIKKYIKKILKAQERDRLKDISGFYFEYFDANNIVCLFEQLESYLHLYENPDSYVDPDEYPEGYDFYNNSEYLGFKELFELICLLYDKIKIKEPIIRFESDSDSDSN